MQVKKCTKCGQEKPATSEYFYKKSDSKDGLHHDCKVCRKSRNKAYYEVKKEVIAERHKAHYEANKEAILKRGKAYYEANKEAIAEQSKAYREANKEAILEQKKAYYEANKEAILEQKKAYREANKEAIAERGKSRYKTNRETILEQRKAYYEVNKETIAERDKAYYRTPKGKYGRIKQNANERGIHFSLPFRLYESKLWGEPCHYCGCDIEITGLDRKDSNKGYIPDNVVPCCWDCNKKKNTKLYEEFLQEIKINTCN